jgi:hypothetical protein
MGMKWEESAGQWVRLQERKNLLTSWSWISSLHNCDDTVKFSRHLNSTADLAKYLGVSIKYENFFNGDDIGYYGAYKNSIGFS